MLNLSITACSFYLREAYSIGTQRIYALNKPIKIKKSKKGPVQFENAFCLFEKFLKAYTNITDDAENQKAFKCTYKNEIVETEEFIMFPVLINSGMYGSTSDIINIKTKEVKYSKKVTDVDFKQFYFMIVFPKDNVDNIIQKGMFIFQNIGPYGVKTLITQKLQEFLSDYNITLTCNTVAPSLFVKKVLTDKNIKKITIIKNYKSSDAVDNYNNGYGQEIRTLANLNFSQPIWDEIKEKMLHFSGAKGRVFEFEKKNYDNVKVVVQLGEITRTISLNNIENLSIIESVPKEVRDISGNADKEKLIEYLKEVIKEYLKEMSLTF